MEQDLSVKYDSLKKSLEETGSLAVAFSGGVDSTFLLRVAHDMLGDRLLAVTADLDSFPDIEMTAAVDFCREAGIHHIVAKADQLAIEGFRNNWPDRCYHCKKIVFQRVYEAAAQKGIRTVADGTNADDLGTYRPGLKALRELGVKSPLADSGFSKQEIRILSRELGLPTWNKPSFACLATRFPYHEPITKNKLMIVEEAERFLIDRKFRQMRVRAHGAAARIEVPEEDFGRLIEPGIRKAVNKKFHELGFDYVTMDLDGFRSGSMDENMEDMK